MPNSELANNSILSTEMELPPQTLDAAEVSDYLGFLFSDVAFKPAIWLLRETAAVARYLDWLSLSGIPGDICNQAHAPRSRYYKSEPAAEHHKLSKRAV